MKRENKKIYERKKFEFNTLYICMQQAFIFLLQAYRGHMAYEEGATKALGRYHMFLSFWFLFRSIQIHTAMPQGRDGGRRAAVLSLRRTRMVGHFPIPSIKRCWWGVCGQGRRAGIYHCEMRSRLGTLRK